MQVSVEQTSALERRMEVSVPKERVEQAIAERLQRVARSAKLKGFRPGKVPLKVIRQQFGAQVRQEVLSDLVQSSFTEAVTQQQLNPAAGPRIEPLSSGAGEDLRYRAVFEVFPQIELRGIEGLEVVRPVAEVSTADIDAMVENLREQRPNYIAVDRPSQTGDRVTMNFEGRVDGKTFEGSTGEKVSVLLGGGRMLADFEGGVTGVSADEHLQLVVRYPDDYHNKALAGREALFEVQMLAVEEKQLPALDDDFCREYGVFDGGIEQLRTEVGENMRRELETNVRARLKQQVLDGLLAANPTEVPKSLLDAQVREMQIDMARRMGAKDASQVPTPEPFLEPARRRVALGILIGELIRSRGIKLDRAKVEERLQEIVSAQQDPDATLKAYRQNPEALRQVENLVLEDSVVEHLLERAKLTDQSSSFKDIMNFGA